MKKIASKVVGVDFDNTLINYNRVFLKLVQEQGLPVEIQNPTKKSIRDRVRELPDGEITWQKMQSVAYGPRIQEAALSDGAWDFLSRCRRETIPLYILSHKSQFAAQENGRTDLRRAALDWLDAQHFFDPQGLGLPREAVLFSDTRAAKIAKIRELQCRYFIDDLEETFLENDFPTETQKILYVPDGRPGKAKGALVMTSWQEIGRCIFHD